MYTAFTKPVPRRRSIRAGVARNVPLKTYGLLAAVSAALILCGCNDLPSDVRPLSDSNEEIRSLLDDYGTCTMSSPVFTEPQPGFAFNPGVGPSNFYQDAKSSVQGQFASLSAIASNAGLSLAFTGGLKTSAPQLPTPPAAPQSFFFTQAPSTSSGSGGGTTSGGSTGGGSSGTGSTGSGATGTTGSGGTGGSDTGGTGTTGTGGSGTGTGGSGGTTTGTSGGTTTSTTTTANTSSPLQLQPFQALLSGQTAPTLTDRNALIEAAGDTATSAIFQVLGDATLTSQFADKKVLMAVVTVAVNPGLKTYQDFAVDLSVKATYMYRPARLAVVNNFVNDASYDISLRKRVAMSYGLTLPSGSGDPFDVTQPIPEPYRELDVESYNANVQPAVAAVSPMTQSDTVVSQDSTRTGAQLALNLAGAFAAANMQAEANFFADYAKSLQSDSDEIQTRTTVNTYSVNGGLFGFEISPTWRAVKKGGSRSYLERTTFPALILLGFDADELRPRLLRNSFGQLQVVEPQLALSSYSTWIPVRELARHIPSDLWLAYDKHQLDAEDEVNKGHTAGTDEERKERVEAFLDDLQDTANAKPREKELDADDQLNDLKSLLADKMDKTPRTREFQRQRRTLHRLKVELDDLTAYSGLPQASANTARQYLAEVDTEIRAMRKVAASLTVAPSSSAAQKQPAGDENDAVIVELGATFGAFVGSTVDAGEPATTDPSTGDQQHASGEAQAVVDMANRITRRLDGITRLRLRIAQDLLVLRPHDKPDFADALTQLKLIQILLNDLDEQGADNFVKLDQLRRAQQAADKTKTPSKPTLAQAVVQGFENLLLNKPDSSAPQPDTSDKLDQDQAATLKAMQRAQELCVAVDDILSNAQTFGSTAQEQWNQLKLDAKGLQSLLFPESTPAAPKSTFGVKLAWLPPNTDQPSNPDSRDLYNNFDTVEGLANDYSSVLAFKLFGGFSQDYLPLQLVEPTASKPPSITKVVSDFVPSIAHQMPDATQSITLTLIGQNLNNLTAGTLATAVVLPQPDAPAGAASPVTVLDGPTVASGINDVATVHVTVNPTYKQAFALQLAVTGSSNPPPILTPPIAIARLDPVTLNGKLIRQVIGPLNDPTQQTLDEQQFIGMNAEEVRAKLEQQKPEQRSINDYDVNVGFGSASRHSSNGAATEH